MNGLPQKENAPFGAEKEITLSFAAYSLQQAEGYFMKLSGSGIYITSLSTDLGVYLVHWTHSFCAFIITQEPLFFKMG